MRLPVTTTTFGTRVIHDKKIFRAGTFKDSMGTLRTWTVEQLDQMVENFRILRERNLLGGVPVRVDHDFSAESVVGWVSDVRRDGEFLVADFHMTEPEAFEKWVRGTLEPVSSEIIPYEANTGDVYFPTLIGVAFVDIPAVAGLYRASGVQEKRVTAVFVNTPMLDSKSGSVYESAQEDHMPTSSKIFSPQLAAMTTAELAERATTHSAPVAVVTPVTPAAADADDDATDHAPADATEAAAEVEGASAGATDAPAADEDADEPPAADEDADEPLAADEDADEPLAADEDADEPLAADEDADEDAADAPIPVTEPRSGAVHSAQRMTFRVGGVQVTDPDLVQAHIDSLEAFQSSAIHSQRKEFVQGLVRDNKILAGQAEALTELALSMDSSQYQKFVASYEVAGANPLMAQHGRPAQQAAIVHSGQSVESLRDEMTVHEQIIERHKLAGKPQEWIEQTQSFRRYTELKTQLHV